MKWEKSTRSNGLVEWVCEKHGTGHPDYESAKLIAKHYGHPVDAWLTHGCCGCCHSEEFPGKQKKDVTNG